MATHFINSTSTVNAYKETSINSQILFVLEPDTQFTVVEEYVGINCSFHKIKYNEVSCYVENSFITNLPSTPVSAPYVCSVGLQTYSYVEPNWYTLSEDEPFFNSNTKEYCITITAPISKIGNRIQLINDCKRKAIQKLFGYYNKDATDTTVDLYNSYYIFAEYKDLYVPVRPMAKTKVLIAIKQKYFDAVPVIENELDLTSDPFIENANFIISIPFKDFESEMIKLSDVLKLYNFDVLVSNSKVGFRFGTKENELYNTSEDIINELSLSEKADKIIDFHSLVLSHLNENSFPLYTERQLNNVKIEFAINDQCNKLYSFAINENGTCRIPKIGLQQFLNKDPINDETVINFIKNYKTINSLEKCKVSWVSFVERFLYPKVIVKNISVNDLVKNYQKGDYQVLKEFLKLYNSINEQNNSKPIKTIQEIDELEATIADLKICTALSLTKDSLLARTTYVGDNSFDPTALEKSLKQLYLINDRSDDSLETKEQNASKKAEEFLLIKIYDYLNKVGICRLIDFSLGCLANNINDFVDIDLEATITMGTIKSLDTEELLNNVVTSLPKEQQQIFYNALLLDNSYINSKSLLYQLKTTLPTEQYEALNLENASYENIVSVTAQLMSTET